MIHQRHSQGVFGLIDEVIDALAPALAYRALFDKALAGVRQAADASPIFLPVDLPMAVADVLGRPVAEACVAAAASTLVWSGADLMDDAADAELTEDWAGVSPSQIALVSTNLLSTLPHLLVGEIDPGDGSIASAYSQALARTLFVMSAGQSVDLDSAASVRTVDDYLDLVRRKSGAEFALFASTPALLAGADAETVGAWVRFGFAYGSMIQIFSDTVSTVAEGPRNDLLSGKRTLPVLHADASIGDTEHSSFAADLDLASKGDHCAVARAIQAMSELGTVRKSLETVELQRFRAVKALPVALTDLPKEHPLRVMLRACSVV
ncbi:MAG: polyprenyl synthetase family protein [Candidatus Binatia bacterium]